jgi:urease subunit beta
VRPGEVIVGAEPIELNPGRPVTVVRVANTGDRPVQVGSHFHLAVANEALELDRVQAWGQRLAVASGTAVRFEPGIDVEVQLVPFGGDRVVPGLQIGSGGPLDRRS